VGPMIFPNANISTTQRATLRAWALNN
jgi:hypothetical protein